MKIKNMFINYSNHPSDSWLKEQREAALEYGEIVDVCFPPVGVALDGEGVYELAKKECKKLLEMVGPEDVVMCQGEFNLSYIVVRTLKAKGIRVVSSVSERCSTEKIENGVKVKKSTFVFAGFRDYVDRICEV